jgi:hypothetical protein
VFGAWASKTGNESVVGTRHELYSSFTPPLGSLSAGVVDPQIHFRIGFLSVSSVKSVVKSFLLASANSEDTDKLTKAKAWTTDGSDFTDQNGILTFVGLGRRARIGSGVGVEVGV